MATGRHLTETSTPMEVAATSAALAEVRRLWALVEAWEQGHATGSEGPYHYQVGDITEGNPYAPAFRRAAEQYEAWREEVAT